MAECSGKGTCETFWLPVFLTFQLEKTLEHSKFKKSIKELKKAIQIHPFVLQFVLHCKGSALDVYKGSKNCVISFTENGGMVGSEVKKNDNQLSFFFIFFFLYPPIVNSPNHS